MTKSTTTTVLSKFTERRNILRMGAGVAVALMASPVLAKSISPVSVNGERSLSLYNIHTGESLNTVYWQDGIYIPDEMASINHILRDRRNGEMEQMDIRLIDMLSELHNRVDGKRAFQVISGYRSPASNNTLRKVSAKGGVAKKSLHMQGRAMDIRLPRIELKHLHKAAVQMKKGGVGYYPRDGFIHVDTGRVRYWGQHA